MNVRQQAETVHAGHAYITDDDIRLFEFQSLHQGVTIVKALGVNASLAQRFFQHPANRAVVVDNPYFSGSVHVQLPVGYTG